MLEEGKLDAIINVKPGMVDNAYLSQRVITFHNRVFTLDQTAFHLRGSANAASQRFQRARQILGTEFLTSSPEIPAMKRWRGRKARYSGCCWDAPMP